MFSENDHASRITKSVHAGVSISSTEVSHVQVLYSLSLKGCQFQGRAPHISYQPSLPPVDLRRPFPPGLIPSIPRFPFGILSKLLFVPPQTNN